ncbi:MAG: helix-turn-helix transcriptional regulator, partial [Sphingomonadales bacterium]|nr:helix-turn-helix transcriptional regulator [Sphingomonadales bacterium]
MNRSQSDSERLLAVLKRELKSHGWTGARIARKLSIGEATVKRWLAGKSATIDRLSKLAELCGLSLADLVRKAERPASGLQ